MANSSPSDEKIVPQWDTKVSPAVCYLTRNLTPTVTFPPYMILSTLWKTTKETRTKTTPTIRYLAAPLSEKDFPDLVFIAYASFFCWLRILPVQNNRRFLSRGQTHSFLLRPALRIYCCRSDSRTARLKRPILRVSSNCFSSRPIV